MFIDTSYNNICFLRIANLDKYDNMIEPMNILCLHLFKYLLVPFNRCMHHSMFDFILDQKNIQTINKRKTKDCYIAIQKQLCVI